jgi:hypothetical protein
MSIPLRRILVVLVLLFVSLPATATQVEYLPVETLGSESPVVVRGEVTDVRAYWNDGRTRILTETTVRVDERYKGPSSREVRIVQMGGELDGVRMTVAGALEWMPGEDVVLFLEDSLPGRYRVAGFTQGKFGVQVDPRTGEEFVVQAGLGETELVGVSRSVLDERLPLSDLLRRALPQIYEGE